MDKELNQIYLEPTCGFPPLIIFAKRRLTQTGAENMKQSYARAAAQKSPCLIMELPDIDVYQLVAGKWEPVRKPECANDIACHDANSTTHE